MSVEQPGVVVVGTGFGCRVHVPAARAAGLDVVALVGRDRERTERRAARSGVDVACGSLAEALQLPHSDIVVVSTSPGTHAELAAEAIAAGRHVLVEKPFTLDAAEARGLVEAADRAGVVALVGHEFRFVPQRVTFRQALADEIVGPPKLATFLGHLSLVASVDAPAPPWWFDPTQGGGWLGASVSHLVDAIRTWLGEFDTVSASLPMVSGRDPSTQAEDSASIRFAMRSGCEGFIQQSAGVWGSRIEIMRVAGPLGTLDLDGEVVRFADADGVRDLDLVGAPLPVDVAPSDDPRHRFTHIELGPATVQAGIVRDLARGATPEYDLVPAATFADGLACMEVLDAVRRSAADRGATTSVARA